MRNIEIKTRLRDRPRVESELRALGATDAGLETQVDTFYAVARGRLKLRASSRDGAVLIHYERLDQGAPRASDYTLVPVADARALHGALERALGCVGRVAKERHLYWLDNVRVHLDRVEGLGEFLELEAIVGPANDDAECRRCCEQLLEQLGIGPEDRMAVAYVDLVDERSANAGDPAARPR